MILMIFLYVAVVIDTDGSAFITKAEFDSLKNNFQAQIDNYNSSIDSKIDGAIAAYLAGIKVSTNLEYPTVFGSATTNPFYIYKDVKSAMAPFYYADAGMSIVCAMSWGSNPAENASFCALTLDYDGEPLYGVLYGSWDGNTGSHASPQNYYAKCTPEVKISYGAQNGENCGGTWGTSSGWLKTEFTNSSSQFRRGDFGDTDVVLNGSQIDKVVWSGAFHFGSDDANKSGDNTLEWSEIPTWKSTYTFCGGSGVNSNSNGYWNIKNPTSNVASFAINNTNACIPFINGSRDKSAYLRVQSRIKTQPTERYESHAIYNLGRSITGLNTTSTKDKPRDPLWCRLSYWPNVVVPSNNNTKPTTATDWRNSAIIPVGSLQSETLIPSLNINGTNCTYTVWSGCPLYRVDRTCSKCTFTIKLDKAWDAGADIKFKLRFNTSTSGFTKSEATGGVTDKYKIDGVDNDGANWVSAGEHTIVLTEGVNSGDVIWLSWITDTAGDGGKLIDCSDYATAEVAN